MTNKKVMSGIVRRQQLGNGYTTKKCVILGARALVRVPNITHF